MLGRHVLQLQKLSSKCDVVIVNYNSGGFLSPSVASVLNENVASVIVVDNGSYDESLSLLERNFSHELRLRVIRNNSNLGFARACNIGVGVSSAPYILFLNPDCTLESGALEKMMAILRCDQKGGMVGGHLCNPDGTEQPGGRRVIPTPRRAFVRAFGLSKFEKLSPVIFSDFLLHKEPLPTEPVAVEVISGACIGVKRKALADVGLWDEGYFLHCEDLDWCMRFRQQGWKILFVPDAKVIHFKGACSRTRPIFVEWHKHKGMMRFYRKFFRHQYPGILMWLVALGVWLRFSMILGKISVQRTIQFISRAKD